MSADYAPAEWIPTSHFWSGRGGHAPRWIIVHGTAGGGTAQDVARYFQSNDPPTSTHFVIGRDGHVVQCVAEADSAWGNGVVTQGHDAWWTPKLNPNFLTFSIEHCKPDTENHSDLTQAQKEASFALIAHLCAKYNIPTRAADANGGITGHSSIDPVNRTLCPGPYPWDELWGYLEGEGTVGVPQGWKDDGSTLIAPNGQKVTLGFRWYVLTHPWQADNWPLEDEYGVDTIDITNPSLGAGDVQHFRRSILAWQKSTNQIYDLWAGSIAQAWEQRTHSAEHAQAAAAQQYASASSKAATSGGASTTNANLPLAYLPPMPMAGSASGPKSVPSAGTPPAGLFAVAAAASDPVTQRVASLEQQIQTLLEGLGSNKSTSKVVKDVESKLGLVGDQLGDPKARKALLSNPGSLIRWVLMIVGLLFSDAVAWAVSSLLHHQTSLPLPFLTAGTVILSGLLVFGGAFRLQKP